MGQNMKQLPTAKKEESVMDKLLALIRTEAYPEGARLPSERMLAVQLGTSRNTLRGAIRRLETMGMVDIRRGSGCYVCRKNGAPRQWPRPPLNESIESIAYRLEAGFFFEPTIGALAAKRMEPEQVETLEQCVVKLSRAIINGHTEKIVEEDTRFRMIIAAGTNNPVFELTMQQMAPLGKKACRVVERLNKKERECFFADYVEILKAIKAKNPELTRLRLSDNLLRMGQFLKKYGGIELPGPMAEDNSVERR